MLLFVDMSRFVPTVRCKMQEEAKSILLIYEIGQEHSDYTSAYHCYYP